TISGSERELHRPSGAGTSSQHLPKHGGRHCRKREGIERLAPLLKRTYTCIRLAKDRRSSSCCGRGRVRIRHRSATHISSELCVKPSPEKWRGFGCCIRVSRGSEKVRGRRA